LEAVASGEIPVLYDQGRAKRNGAAEVETLQGSRSGEKTRGVGGKVAEGGRVQDKDITTREELAELIALRKKEFDNVLDRYDSLKIEIIKLEEELHGMGESLNNPVSCHNQIKFALKKCEECGFYGRCIYRGKGDYGRFKL